MEKVPARHGKQSDSAVRPDCDEKVPAGLGTCVWEGGLALLRVLELSPSLVKGKSVLELGCGTGLVGLAAAAAGAERVCLTDRVLSVAEANRRANFAREEPPRRTLSG